MLRYLETAEPPFPRLLLGPVVLNYPGSPSDPLIQVQDLYCVACLLSPSLRYTRVVQQAARGFDFDR